MTDESDWEKLLFGFPTSRLGPEWQEPGPSGFPAPPPPWSAPVPPYHVWDVADYGCCGGCETCGTRQEHAYCRICGLEDYFPYEEHCPAWCLVPLETYRWATGIDE